MKCTITVLLGTFALRSVSKVAKVENTFVEAVSIYKRIMHIKTFKRKRKIIYL